LIVIQKKKRTLGKIDDRELTAGPTAGRGKILYQAIEPNYKGPREGKGCGKNEHHCQERNVNEAGGCLRNGTQCWTKRG